jgi:hypothetical protein
MRRGITNTTEKIRNEESVTDKHNLGNLDLLNLRLNLVPKKSKKNLEKEAGSGDNQLIPATSTKVRNSVIFCTYLFTYCNHSTYPEQFETVSS